MKRFLILFLLALIVTALHANGACLLRDVQKEQNCTGGAAKIPDEDKQEHLNSTEKETLRQMYEPPTMAVPVPYRNGFPILNQNCMFGGCLSK